MDVRSTSPSPFPSGSNPVSNPIETGFEPDRKGKLERAIGRPRSVRTRRTGRTEAMGGAGKEPSEYVVRTAEGETAEGGSSSGSDRTISVELTEVNSRPWVGRLGGEEMVHAQLQPGSASSV